MPAPPAGSRSLRCAGLKAFRELWKKTLLSDQGEAMFGSGNCSFSSAGQLQARLAPVAERWNWFAVYTSPRHEKRVAEQCEARRIEAFLPLYPSERRWRNRCRVTVHSPVFPNYVFVHLLANQHVPVLQVPGVLGLVGSASRPVPLPDSEVEALRSGLHLRRCEPYPHLAIGEHVRIKSGALAGMEGVLIRMKNRSRVVLTVRAILRSVAVEVEADDIEPCCGPRPARS
jgi:transcription antitermination factor NusG